MIHLDTSFLIRALVPDSPEHRSLQLWLGEGSEFAMSAICWAEFLCGPVEEEHVELVSRIVNERVPFLAEDASGAARLFNLSGRRRGSLVDCMIAATALRAGATLASSNPRDFERLAAAGLRMAAAP